VFADPGKNRGGEVISSYRAKIRVAGILQELSKNHVCTRKSDSFDVGSA
jgi:hypothetical protein